jgi:hypothetical protein
VVQAFKAKKILMATRSFRRNLKVLTDAVFQPKIPITIQVNRTTLDTGTL